jgi:glutaconyl-CoA/methylmalonyl-CoA decarboxylase subunit gamma
MKKLRVTVDGKAYEVLVEVLGDSTLGDSTFGGNTPGGNRPARGTIGSAAVSAPSAIGKRLADSVAEEGAVVSPMSGSIIKVLVKNGDKVSAGQEVILLEAMKMETPISAPTDGTISGLDVTPGTTVEEGQPLFKLES